MLSEGCPWFEDIKSKEGYGLLTVSMGQNVAFSSLKILIGDSRRKNPRTVK